MKLDQQKCYEVEMENVTAADEAKRDLQDQYRGKVQIDFIIKGREQADSTPKIKPEDMDQILQDLFPKPQAATRNVSDSYDIPSYSVGQTTMADSSKLSKENSI